MTERLLQFIWQFQYYNRQALQTTAGEALEIVFPGTLNENQGPDFKQARIKINQVLWAGDIELHLQSSAWHQHRHHLDENYSKVILHVVYENNRVITDVHGNIIPALELGSRIPAMLLQRYQYWMHLPQPIPCHADIQHTPPLVWQSWKQRLLVERLQQKAAHIEQLLLQTGGHWEQVCWQLTCRYFGGPVNAESFEQIAASLPISILAKHKLQLHQLEALLLGQAQFLQLSFEEHYPILLQKEYQFLQAKYKLQPVALAPVFLRMRPTSFPTVRLAQLAMLIHQSVHVFSKLVEAASVSEVSKLYNVTAGAFWNNHFRLHETSTHQPKKTGIQLIDTVLINVAVPLLFAYGRHVNEPKHMDRALAFLDEIAAEKNHITKAFEILGIENKNAFTSQALLQLKKHYCDEKLCLQCGVGNALLKRSWQ